MSQNTVSQNTVNQDSLRQNTATTPVSSPTANRMAPSSSAAFVDTPSRLSRRSILTSILLLAYTLAGLAILENVRSSMRGASRAAEQMLLVEDTRVLLSRADSLATGGFLRGGIQPDQEIADFATNISDATTKLAEVKRGTGGAPAGKSLEQLSKYLADTTAAQANNRQGFPVGATFQKLASKRMRADILAPLDEIDATARASLATTTRRFQRFRIVWILYVLLALIPILLGLRALLKATNRLINVPVALAGVVITLATLFAQSLSANALRDAISRTKDQVRTQDLYGQARSALYDAKSAESLTLIARGSGQGYESQWKSSMAVVESAVGLRGERDQYVRAHEAMRELDDGGDWDSARKQVIEADGSVALAFRQLDEGLDGRRSTGSRFEPFGSFKVRIGQIVLLLGGLVSALLTRLGFGQRIREYR